MKSRLTTILLLTIFTCSLYGQINSQTNTEAKDKTIFITGGVFDKVYINYDLSSARYYALIIAVEDYDDPKINDLAEPINDADKFFRIISSRYTFNQEDITYLKNPTKADIIGTLHKMRGFIKEEDNLLIYYAGHGYWDEEMMTGYWLPTSGDLHVDGVC